MSGPTKSFPAGTVRVEKSADQRLPYSVCTLVSDVSLYRDAVYSFREKGFGEDSEFLYVDNTSGNRLDAFAGLNRMISRASGEYLILCHQDVLLIDDEEVLAARLGELESLDPRWAVAGNAGATERGNGIGRITDGTGLDRHSGSMPARVVSLDENFLVLKRAANLGFSGDLSGFHFYGTDIVTQANLAGYTAYVIDFHLEHRGLGATGEAFTEAASALERKYESALQARRIRTTVTDTHVGRLNVVDRVGLALRKRRRRRREKTAGMRSVGLKKLRFRLHELIHGPRYEIDGQRFRIPASTPLIAKRAIWKQSYEEPERILASRYLEPGQTVVELGGSFGIVGHFVRQTIGPEARHVIVEANPALLEYCAENGIPPESAGHATLVNAAISYDGVDAVSFRVTEGLHDSRLADGTGSAADTITVPALTLSDLLAEQGIDGPYALVCDIEGAEFDILLNDPQALSQCVCAVIELHPRFFCEAGRTVSAFLARFEAAGFEVVDRVENVIVGTKKTAQAG